MGLSTAYLVAVLGSREYKSVRAWRPRNCEEIILKRVRELSLLSKNISHFPTSTQQKLVYLAYGTVLNAMSRINVLAEHGLAKQTLSLTNHSMLFSNAPDMNLS